MELPFLGRVCCFEQEKKPTYKQTNKQEFSPASQGWQSRKISQTLCLFKWCYGISFTFPLFIYPANYSLDKFEHSLHATAFTSQLILPPSPLINSTVPCTSLCTILNLPFPSTAPRLPMGSACFPPLQRSEELFPNNPLGVISWKPVLDKLKSPYCYIPHVGAQEEHWTPPFSVSAWFTVQAQGIKLT